MQDERAPATGALFLWQRPTGRSDVAAARNRRTACRTTAAPEDDEPHCGAAHLAAALAVRELQLDAPVTLQASLVCTCLEWTELAETGRHQSLRRHPTADEIAHNRDRARR